MPNDATRKPVDRAGVTNSAKRPRAAHEWGVGEMADGTVNIFDPWELPAKLEELRLLEEAALGKDDLSDPDDTVKALESVKRKSGGE
jgi:hypothetical protein